MKGKQNKPKKRVLDLNNDADYEEFIKLQNLAVEAPRARRHSPGQYKTPIPVNQDGE